MASAGVGRVHPLLFHAPSTHAPSRHAAADVYAGIRSANNTMRTCISYDILSRTIYQGSDEPEVTRKGTLPDKALSNRTLTIYVNPICGARGWPCHLKTQVVWL